MAQYRIDQNKYLGDGTTIFESVMLGDKVTSGGNLLDAFGRIRTSEPYTLFDSTFRYTDDTRNWDTSNTGSANAAHSVNTSSMQMNVGTTSGDKVIRQTKRYFLYQPGKSLLTINSFTMQPKTNVRQRCGYFDTNNGIFLEHDGAGLFIVKRSKVSGSVVDTRIPQAEWSEDKFDGTGYSKITLDPSKTQILWSDIEWLGAGTMRVGFVVNGVFYTAHKFHHANLITSTYMATATLPIRLEIENTGTSASNTSLEHICNTVVSEGGHTPRVSTRAIANPVAGVNISNVTYTPLIAVRLKSSNPGGVVVPAHLSLYGLQNTPFNYRILMDATISGGTWVSAASESHAEYNITATSFTGGRSLFEGMFIGGTAVQPLSIALKDFNSSYQLRTRINGTSETFLIAALATTNNDDALASLAWEEYN